MKKIFEKPHNILFIISAVIFLQFLSAVICFYAETTDYLNFGDWSTYIYMAYCLIVCVISAIFIIKNQKQTERWGKNEKTDSINSVRMWAAGFFLYAFTEIIFFIKLLYTAYDSLSGLILDNDLVYNLWDNEFLFRLCVCIAIIFIIYCALFIIEGKKLYIGFGAVNLVILALCIIFIQGGESLLIDAGASFISVAFTEIVREAGILIFLLNIFIFALYKLYTDK